MTLEALKQLLSEGSYGTLIDEIRQSREFIFDEIKEEFNIEGHDIFDKTIRPDKYIKSPKLDSQGDPVRDTDGNLVEEATKVINVTRLALPLQEKIVKTAASFLCGNPIKLDGSPKNDNESAFINIVEKIWSDNKLDYKSKKLAKLMMSETECAELYYNPAADEGAWEGTVMKSAFKLRMRILANSYGDKLYPVFDDTGDMIAFGRGFITVDDNNQDVENFELFTNDETIRSVKKSDTWETQTPEKNIVGKIPVIYYSQPKVEWADVQNMIARLETKLSNHADTNDYFDSPVLVTEGQPVSMPGKEELGKMVSVEVGGKVYYVTWDQAPESTKMEIENLWRFIHNCTDTPDISFETMKSLGNTPSGYAIELMFLSAHLKAADKEENFGESVQRRINYQKAWIGAMDASQKKFSSMAIKPVFEYFLPKNMIEKVNLLNTAKMGGLMSDESAVRQMPKELVQDPDNEIELLKEQNSADTALNNLMNAKTGGGVVKPIKTATK